MTHKLTYPGTLDHLDALLRHIGRFHASTGDELLAKSKATSTFEPTSAIRLWRITNSPNRPFTQATIKALQVNSQKTYVEIWNDSMSLLPEQALAEYCRSLEVECNDGSKSLTQADGPRVNLYPHVERLFPHARIGFREEWLGLSDEDKASWEKMVIMIKEGAKQFEIARELSVGESVISKRLGAKDRVSLGLTMREIRRHMS